MKPFNPRLLQHAKDAKKYIILLVITGTFSTALILAQSFFISRAITPIIDKSQTLSQVMWAVYSLIAVFAMRIAISYINEAYGHRAALRTIYDLRTQVIEHAGKLGERWLAGGKISSTITLVTEALDDLEPYFVKFLPQLILVSTVTPITLGVIIWTDWISAIAIIVCMPLIPLFMILIGKQTAEYSNKRLASMQALGQQLLDLLSGLSTLKALGREKGPRRTVAELGDDFAKKTMKTLYVAFLSGAALEFLTTLSTAIVAVEVGWRLQTGNIDLFSGLLIIMLTPEAFKPLREVGSQFHASSDGVAAAEGVFAILDEPLSSHDGILECPDLSSSTVRFDDVSVKAPGRTTIAPAHFNATIEPQKITLLRGRSGSGKSTSVSTLLRFVEPSEGHIYINDIDIANISHESLWKNITWVPQRPAIIPGTILENLGCEDVSQELIDASTLTGFHSIVQELPKKWNTIIGHGGTGLSVGQRQRLALTRAIITPRPLVILDEPSAHLDAMSEEDVVRTIQHLKEKGNTVLVIAHRKSIDRYGDAIFHVTSTTTSKQTEIATTHTSPTHSRTSEENHE